MTIIMFIVIITDLIGFGDLDEHVLSTWVFVFVRMPFGVGGGDDSLVVT